MLSVLYILAWLVALSTVCLISANLFSISSIGLISQLTSCPGLVWDGILESFSLVSSLLTTIVSANTSILELLDI